MKLSFLLNKLGKLEECKIYNEKEFQVFARITTCLKETRCIFLTDKKYISLIPEGTTMVITTDAFKDIFLERKEGVCICDEPKAVYFNLLNHVAKNEKVKFETIIGEGCEISPHAYIAPFNVLIGNNVKIEEFACVYEGTQIDDYCIIHSGAKIGIQDYNYFKEKKEIKQVIHQGKTILGKNVEIGFNSVVGRALYDYGQTYIGDYSKVACNASIGHDDELGRGVMIGSNVALGGYTSIGDEVSVSMGATIRNGLCIGHHAHVDMGAVVIRNVESEIGVFGNPAKRILSPK